MTKRGHGVNAMKSETQDSHPQEPGTLRNGYRWRVESDSIGEVRVPADRLWGAQTQRSLEHSASATTLSRGR
jgi:hypothetical protein